MKREFWIEPRKSEGSAIIVVVVIISLLFDACSSSSTANHLKWHKNFCFFGNLGNCEERSSALQYHFSLCALGIL